MYLVTLINDGERKTIRSPYFSGEKLVSAVIKSEINSVSSFTFSMLPDNAGYDDVHPLKSLIEVYNTKTGQYDFRGRILMPTEDMDSDGAVIKSYVCEGELSYLNDSVQRYKELKSVTVKEYLEAVIDEHNSTVEDPAGIDKTFRLGIVEGVSPSVKVDMITEYKPTLETIKDNVVDVHGGEIRVRNESGVRYLDYSDEFGEFKGTEIRLARNLRSVTRSTDPTEVISKLIPLGKTLEDSNERLTISEVNNGLDYIIDEDARERFGIIAKTVEYNDIEDADDLKVLAKEYLKEHNNAEVNYSVDALDLSLIDLDVDSFEMYNTYQLVNPVMGIDDSLRVIGKTVDVISPNNNSLSFGDMFRSASDYQSDIEDVVRVVSEISRETSGFSGSVRVISKEVNEFRELFEQQEELNTEITSALEEINERLKKLEGDQ